MRECDFAPIRGFFFVGASMPIKPFECIPDAEHLFQSVRRREGMSV